MDNNASGLGFEDMVNAFGSMRYAGFQMDQLSKGDEGNTTIDLVNLGHYAGGHNTSEDVINGKKQIVYDLDEANGEYGHAGEDNMTIHLAKQAILSGNADGYDQKAAMYTSTFVREGFLIDQWSDFEGQTGMKSGETSQKMKDYMELKATKYQLGSLMSLENMGLSIAGNANYESLAGQLAYSAMTGEAGNFDWSGGRNLTSLVINTKDRENVSKTDAGKYKGSIILNFDEYGNEVMQGFGRSQGLKQVKNINGEDEFSHKPWNVKNGNTPNGIYEIFDFVKNKLIEGDENFSENGIYGEYQFKTKGKYGDIISSGRNGIQMHTGREDWRQDGSKSGEYPEYLANTKGCVRMSKEFAKLMYDWVKKDNLDTDSNPDYMIVYNGDDDESIKQISEGMKETLVMNPNKKETKISFDSYMKTIYKKNELLEIWDSKKAWGGDKEKNIAYQYITYGPEKTLKKYFDYYKNTKGTELNWVRTR